MQQASLPLVTIAIPTYNRAGSYLPVALNAARAQNYPRLEIIVADNASSDDTASFIQGIRDARLRYLRHQVNIGANRNYNYCLSKARGDYFLLLHDDDAIDDDFVAACMKAAGHKVLDGIIRTGVRVIDHHGDTVRESKNAIGAVSLAEFYQAWFAGKTNWYLANTLFNTRRLRSEGGFRSPYNLAQDGFAIARLARFHRVDLPDVKASFRVHAGENTMADPTDATLWGREYLALVECMCGLVAGCMCGVTAGEDVAALRRRGRRFAAQLAYNRAALMRSPGRRARASYEVLRLFDYRCWPTHRSKTLRFCRQASAYARRRVEKVFSRALGSNASARVSQDRFSS
ncbi:MAG: glycosyltransferase family 2 protein [Candidatus Binatia bacterium]